MKNLSKYTIKQLDKMFASLEPGKFKDRVAKVIEEKVAAKNAS